MTKAKEESVKISHTEGYSKVKAKWEKDHFAKYPHLYSKEQRKELNKKYNKKK